MPKTTSGWMLSDEYHAAIDGMGRAFRVDVAKRAAAAGLDVDQFDSLQDCDLYLQSLEG